MYDNSVYGNPGQVNRMQLLQQAKIQQRIVENQLEIEKESAKVYVREESKLRIYDSKMMMKQREEERRRSTYEEIVMDRDGNVIVVTRNLSIQAQPRQVTDMRSPQVYIAERKFGKIRRVFIVSCLVGECEKLIFLDAKKIDKGAYLLGKFAEAGISFFAPSARAKDYAKQLLAMLVRNGVVVEIPDEVGWTVADDGKFWFVDDRRLTWEEIMQKI